MDDSVEEEHTTPVKEDSNISSIEQIIEIADEEEYFRARDQFIEYKLQELRHGVKAKKFSVLSPPYKGFIHPDSEVKPAAFLDGFKLDDNGIYSNLVDNIRNYRRDERWKTRSIREINPYAVLKTIGEYYGNYTADEGLEGNHHNYYMNRSTVDSEAMSLAELKGQGIAMCTEKAAAAQNLVTFLGYESDFCLSQNCELVEGNKEMHAFNLLKSDRGSFIFEPTNPIIVTNSEGNIVNFLPAIYKITDDQYTGLISGGEVAVQHTDYSVTEGKYVPQQAETRKYGGLGKDSL